MSGYFLVLMDYKLSFIPFSAQLFQVNFFSFLLPFSFCSCYAVKKTQVGWGEPDRNFYATFGSL